MRCGGGAPPSLRSGELEQLVKLLRVRPRLQIAREELHPRSASAREEMKP